MRAEVLCMEATPEVAEAGSLWETAALSFACRWSGAGLCWEEACTRRSSCWRTGVESTAEAAGWRLAMGAGGGPRSRRMGAVGTCVVSCRQAWRGGCRWDSGGEGRTGSG